MEFALALEFYCFVVLSESSNDALRFNRWQIANVFTFHLYGDGSNPCVVKLIISFIMWKPEWIAQLLNCFYHLG